MIQIIVNFIKIIILNKQMKILIKLNLKIKIMNKLMKIIKKQINI